MYMNMKSLSYCFEKDVWSHFALKKSIDDVLLLFKKDCCYEKAKDWYFKSAAKEIIDYHYIVARKSIDQILLLWKSKHFICFKSNLKNVFLKAYILIMLEMKIL